MQLSGTNLVGSLRADFNGRLIAPDDPGYDGCANGFLRRY
jgi:hypothetical protein